MSSTFFTGNRKLIGVAEQVDADTPRAAPTHFFQITAWTKDPVRTQAPLEETDRSTQQGRNHVTAFTPAFSCDLYGRPSELDIIGRSVLWSGTATETTHSSTSEPDQDPVYWTVWEIEPDLYTNRYDGCVGVAASFTAQDEGQTELRVTGWQFIALGFLAGVAEPSLPAVSEELPYLFAEVAVSYDSVHPGTTSAFTVNVTRNAKRITADNGFRSKAVVPGKLQVDGTITRYVESDDIMRAVDTGATGGTAPTVAIYDEALDILFDRPTASSSFLIASQGIAYPTREQAINLDGSPLAEVLGFTTQPQTDAGDNISLVAVG